MIRKDNFVFIEHILDSIKDIESFTEKVSKQEFFENKEKQNAVVRSLEIIGEASKNISEDFKGKYKNIEWREIIRTRDKIIHHYFGVDLEIIWKIIKLDLPVLKRRLKEIFEIKGRLN